MLCTLGTAGGQHLISNSIVSHSLDPLRYLVTKIKVITR